MRCGKTFVYSIDRVHPTSGLHQLCKCLVQNLASRLTPRTSHCVFNLGIRNAQFAPRTFHLRLQHQQREGGTIKLMVTVDGREIPPGTIGILQTAQDVRLTAQVPASLVRG